MQVTHAASYFHTEVSEARVYQDTFPNVQNSFGRDSRVINQAQ